jgi:hypothetical protein
LVPLATTIRTTTVVAVTALVAAGPSTVPTEPAGELSAFERSLDRLPASSLQRDGAILMYVDMELAWQRLGVGADQAQRLERIGNLITAEDSTELPQLFGAQFTQFDEATAEVGFSVIGIEREIAVQAPPNSIYVDEVSVSTPAIDLAVRTDPAWADELEVTESEHGAYYTWGDDPTAMEMTRMTPMRQFGQGGALAAIDDVDGAGATVVRALDPADVEAVLATMADATESLLDSALGSALADAVTGDAAVLQMMAIPQPTLFDPSAIMPEADVEALFADYVLLQPYEGVAIVELYDGTDAHTEVLLFNSSAGAAAANASFVEQALATNVDLISSEPLAGLLPDATVTTEGSTVVVTLSFEGAYPRARQLLLTRSLFPAA